MRYRNDFVTNSSSSSYVIMYKTMQELPKEIVEQYPFLKMYVNVFEKMFEKENTVIKTVEELKIHIVNYFGLSYGMPKDATFEEMINESDCDEKDLYEEYLKRINKGYTIVVKEVEYHSYEFEELLNSMHDGENIIVSKSY